MASGLSVRIWARRLPPLLWAQTRTDVIAPDPAAPVDAFALNSNNNDVVRYRLASVQHQGAARGAATVTLYAPATGKSNPVYIFVIVAEGTCACVYVRA